MNLKEKIKHAKELINKTIKDYQKIAVACSFGKDSMVIVHLVKQINPNIPIFSVMTPYKPKETFEYLIRMYEEMNLKPFTVYMVGDRIPKKLVEKKIKVILLRPDKFIKAATEIREKTGKEIFEENPDMCCDLLKVEPTKIALRDLDAWICGLRNTEGRTRKNYQEIESEGGLIKINPILTFTEEEVLQYLEENKVALHPWYSKVLPDGKRYRSLGCGVCTKPIHPNQLEREGRWINTSKCGGECGIHTQKLK